MKKLAIFGLVMMLVFSMSVVSMAFGLDSEQTIGVNLNIDPYAKLTAPASLDFDSDTTDSSTSVDFADGIQDNYEATGTIEYATNSDVTITASSDGFGNDEVNSRVTYQLVSGTSNVLWEKSPVFTDATTTSQWSTSHQGSLTIKAIFNANGTDENWYDVEAGNYSDTITFTVSAN